MVLLQSDTIFAVETPSTISSPHSKFEQTHFKYSRDMKLAMVEWE